MEGLSATSVETREFTAHFTSRSLKIITLEQISENGAWIGLGAGVTFVIMMSILLCVYLVLRLRTSQYQEGWATPKEDECHTRNGDRSMAVNEPSTNASHEPVQADLRSRLLEGDTPKGSPKVLINRGSAPFATSPKRNSSLFNSSGISGLSRESVASLMLRAAELLKDPYSPSYGRLDSKGFGKSPLGLPTREQPLEEMTSAGKESLHKSDSIAQDDNCRSGMHPASGSHPSNVSETSETQVCKEGDLEVRLDSATFASGSGEQSGMGAVPYQPLCCQNIDTGSSARGDDRRPLLSEPSATSRYVMDACTERDTKGTVVSSSGDLSIGNATDHATEPLHTDGEQSRSADTTEEVKGVVDALIDQTLGSVGNTSESWTTQENSCAALEPESKQETGEAMCGSSPKHSSQTLEESVMSGSGDMAFHNTSNEATLHTSEVRDSPPQGASKEEPPGGLDTETGEKLVSRANSTFNNPFYDKSLTRSPSPKLQSSVNPLTPTTPADQRCLPLNSNCKGTNTQPSDGEGWENVWLTESHLVEMPKTIEVSAMTASQPARLTKTCSPVFGTQNDINMFLNTIVSGAGLPFKFLLFQKC